MKLNFRTKLAYGIGGTADNTMYTMTSTFLLFFMTSVVGIRPATAGLIAALGSIWEVICGPIVAYLSDNTVSKWGKRKPYLVFSSIPVMLLTGLLFTPITVSYGVKVTYYLVCTLLFWQIFSSFFVPYMAWGSDLTDDYNERTTLRSYAYVFNQVGMGLGMVLPSLLSGILGWSMTAFIIGICAGGSLLFCALNIKDESKETVLFKIPKIELSIFTAIIKEYIQLIKLRPVRQIIGASLLYLIADTFFMSDRMYYFTYNLGISAQAITLILVITTVLGVALTPFVSKLCNKIDKKNVFVRGMALGGILLIVGRFVSVENIAWTYGLCLFYVIANTCYWQLMPSLLYDVCEVEELASGERHAGQVISLQALSESLSTAVGVQILGIILELSGFTDNAGAQCSTALTWISHSFSLIPGICMVLVALIIHKYPVNVEYFANVKKELEVRRKASK